jgi:hypothetical protein
MIRTAAQVAGDMHMSPRKLRRSPSARTFVRHILEDVFRQRTTPEQVAAVAARVEAAMRGGTKR